MRTAETVLGIIHERGRKGQPLEDIYRQLYNPNLYLRAYARIYANTGVLTPGTTRETIDGMSTAKIDNIIADLRQEKYKWQPVRRVYIPKKNGKQRPLGLPSWSDKLLQEVIRLILEAYYEPQFSEHSHGFRANHGCQTALTEIERTWKGTRWFIEGDISDCFNTINHSILMGILSEKLHDYRFLRLIQNLLEAGYIEEWKYQPTLSGTPQGGIASPILANIYLDKLDKFVEQELIPAYSYGKTRKPNAQYRNILHQSYRQKALGNPEEAKQLRRQAQHLPSLDPNDPSYRRLRYVRYADDIILSFAGPKHEAEEIKQKMAAFLQNRLELKLSQEKTLITHAATYPAHFLGYAISLQLANDKLSEDDGRRVNGRIRLQVPKGEIDRYCSRYMKHGKPTHRAELTIENDFTIISLYQAEYRGIVQYYMLAQNVSAFWKLHWVMQTSLLKTLANKHKTTVKATAHKHCTTKELPEGKYKCLQVTIKRENKPTLTAQFGGIPLKHQAKATITDINPHQNKWAGSNELLKRLLADECELCGSKKNVEVHHIRKLADIKRKGQNEKPQWVKNMIARRRKTLIVCKECHTNIHAGRPTRSSN